VSYDQSLGLSAVARPRRPPDRAFRAMLACAAAAICGFVAVWATPLRFAPLLFVGFFGYLAMFVFAGVTLQGLGHDRMANPDAPPQRLRRFVAWAVIVAGFLPFLLYFGILLLVALGYIHLDLSY